MLSEREVMLMLASAAFGLVAGITIFLVLYARARATEAAIRVELMRTCQNYKEMIERALLVQGLTDKRAELAEREVKVLRGGQ